MDKVLLVGLGRIGFEGFGPTSAAETHYQTIHDRNDLKLMGGVDSDAKKRAEFQRVTSYLVWESLNKALAETSPRFVIVATPPETHSAVVAEALNCPYVDGILCEKPLAPTVKEAKAIVKACRARGVTLLVGHQRRYERRHRQVRKIIASGVIGKVLRAEAYIGGGYLNNGTHAADTARFLADEDIPIEIYDGPRCEFQVAVFGARGFIAINSYGMLDPGYMNEMYDDLLLSTKRGIEPECSGEDGIKAVEIAIAAEAKWKERSGADTVSEGQRVVLSVRRSSGS